MTKENSENIKNIAKFINYLHCCGKKDLMSFASSYSVPKHNLVLKINGAKQLTSDEWESIRDYYIYDEQIAKSLMLSPNTQSSIKKEIFNNFVDNKITHITPGFQNSFIKAMLEGYKEMHDAELEYLFYHHYKSTMHPIKFILHHEPEQNIPQKSIDKLIELELSTINGKMIEPKEYVPTYECFAYVNSENVLRHILENMPNDPAKAERIATSLINAKGIKNEDKDKIFNLYGCNSEDLKRSTAKITNELYLSAVETGYPEDVPLKRDFKDFLVVKKARVFLEHMIRYNFLSEAQECDLAHRIVHEMRIKKDKTGNEMLDYLSKKTKSQNVLHIIVSGALNESNIKSALENEFMSEEDLKNQAHIYCEKIRKKLNKDSLYDIDEDWIDILKIITEKTKVSHADYEIMISSGNQRIMDSIIISKYTPQDVLDKAEKTLDELLKNPLSQYWEMSKLKITMKSILQEIGLNNELYHQFMSNTLYHMLNCFTLGGSLNSMALNYDMLKDYPDMALALTDVLIETLKKANYKPEHSSAEKLYQQIEEFVNKSIKAVEYMDIKDKPAKEMDETQLIRAKEDLLCDFSDTIFMDDLAPYMKLEKIANRFAEIEVKNPTHSTRMDGACRENNQR